MSAQAAGAARRRSAARASGRVRETTVLVVALAVLAALAGVGLCVGDIPLSPSEFFAAVFGYGDRVADVVILQLRGPRVLAALLVGGSLGVACGIVQSIARNPIASPDVIGLTAGASMAGITAIVLFGLSGMALFGAVVVGAVVVAAVIAALAWQHGISGNRLVLVGIGVAAISVGLTGYMLTRGAVQDAATALLWLTGSVNSVDTGVLLALVVAFVVLLALALAQAPRLDVLVLGDDVASSLGVRPNLAKALLVLTAVGLTASAVATAGPVSFVALMSAPIARRLVGRGRTALAPCAAVGAALVVASDLVGQFAIPGVVLPVGVVTGVVGAPYLLWLLAKRR